MYVYEYLWVYLCMCVYECVCVFHIFFFHPFIDGHLGCFDVLAIVNSTVMNIGVHVCFQITKLEFL